MAYGTVQADVIQSSVANTSLGAGNASIMKNRIINGSMTVDQRNAGASVTPTASGYTLDRWRAGLSVSSKYSVQQTTTAPTGFNYSLKATSLSAYTVGASETFVISQFIEGFNTADLGFGTANAKTVTLSFQVYSSLTGTFGGSLRNDTPDRSYPFTYTISSANTWTQISVTIAGDTTGTWLTTNGTGINVTWSLGTGSSFSGTAGAWASGNYTSATGAVSVVGTNEATFYLTGCQLEVGSSATGFEYVNYQTSLANCQRYFETSYSAGVALGTADVNGSYGFRAVNTSSAYNFPFRFAVTKRAIPSMTYYNPNSGASGSFYNGTGAASVSISGSTGIGTSGIQYISDTGGGATSGNFYYVHTAASAEL